MRTFTFYVKNGYNNMNIKLLGLTFYKIYKKSSCTKVLTAGPTNLRLHEYNSHK